MEEFIIEMGHEENEIRSLIEPLLDAEGFELVKLTLKKAQAKAILAIFVDTKAQRNGIVLANLEHISRYLSDVLDAEGEDRQILLGKYDLEVSTPGVDRPLTKISHFQFCQNQKVKVKVKNTENFGSRTLVGKLLDASTSGINVALEGNDTPICIDYADIVSANEVFDFSQLSQPKKKLN